MALSYHFYPGPSKVYPQVREWLLEAYDTGILSIQHRSSTFEEIYAAIVAGFQKNMNLPKEYTVILTSSATECWHILNDTFSNLESHHFFNGAFGQKWFEYRVNNYPKTSFAHSFDLQEEINVQKMSLTNPITNSFDSKIICLTQNETSNSTQIHPSLLSEFRKLYQNDFIFVDATSSLGGQAWNWQDADVWFASVQKCLGLPAGLGVLLVSKNLIDFYKNNAFLFNKVESKHPKRYNDFGFLLDKAKGFQTTYTPNVLNSFLLSKVINFVPFISEIDELLKSRAKEMSLFLENNHFELLVKNERVRSQTVLSVQVNPQNLRDIKEFAKQKNLVLGNGYGDWKHNTFRIANFPQHHDEEFEFLKNFLTLVNQKASF